MTQDETIKATEEPETDAEGNVLKPSRLPDDSGLGPEHDIKLAEAPEGQPGDPDSARFSDRNLKVAIVPVAW